MIKKALILVAILGFWGSVCADTDVQHERVAPIDIKERISDGVVTLQLSSADNTTAVYSMSSDQARLMIIAVLCGVYGAYKLWGMAHGATTELVMQALDPVPGVCSVSDFLCSRFMPTKEIVAASMASGLLVGGLTENMQAGFNCMQTNFYLRAGWNVVKGLWATVAVPAICAV